MPFATISNQNGKKVDDKIIIGWEDLKMDQDKVVMTKKGFRLGWKCFKKRLSA